MNLLNFTHASKENSPPTFYHYPLGRRELPIPPKQHFLKLIFPEQIEGEEDYEVEKITKTSKAIGDKFWYIPSYLQHLQFWFVFCCAII